MIASNIIRLAVSNKRQIQFRSAYSNLQRPCVRTLATSTTGNDNTKPKGTPYKHLTIGVPKETFPLEKRVAATPESVSKLVQPGFTVQIEKDAGLASHFSNVDYEKAGAKLVSNEEIWKNSDIVMKLRPPTMEEAAKLGDKTLISFIYPAQNKELVKQLQDQNATVFAMDCIPRTLSRGQTYDALSSQANISGYRAVIEASNHFGRFFAGQMTAAGKVPPAKVLVLGTGVAGLAAIQTAKNMGAVVRAFDVRPVTKEQVEAMGGQFLEVDYKEDGSGSGGYAKEMSKEWHAAAARMLSKQCEEVDIIITTALIPGKPAPRMITKEMVAKMKPGSVTVDLAAETGGNVETTVKDQCITTDNGKCSLSSHYFLFCFKECFGHLLTDSFFNVKVSLVLDTLISHLDFLQQVVLCTVIIFLSSYFRLDLKQRNRRIISTSIMRMMLYAECLFSKKGS